MSEPIESSESSAPNQPAFAKQAIEGVKRDPAKSMGGAFVVGLILSLFPVGRIVSVILSLALMLLRPALVFLGLLKVVESVGKRVQSQEGGSGMGNGGRS